MSRELAHQLLDDAIAGQYVHPDLIRRALQATGDLTHEWPREEDDEHS
jgi:hypothetical protein